MLVYNIVSISILGMCNSPWWGSIKGSQTRVAEEAYVADVTPFRVDERLIFDGAVFVPREIGQDLEKEFSQLDGFLPTVSGGPVANIVKGYD